MVSPFRPTGKFTDLLVLSDPESCRSWSKKSLPLSTCQSLDLKTDLERDQHRWKIPTPPFDSSFTHLALL